MPTHPHIPYRASASDMQQQSKLKYINKTIERTIKNIGLSIVRVYVEFFLPQQIIQFASVVKANPILIGFESFE